jgi:hypothetical protein
MFDFSKPVDQKYAAANDTISSQSNFSNAES